MVAAAHTQTASGRSGIGADEHRDQPAGAAVGRAARLVTPERPRPTVRQQHYRQIRARKGHRIPFSLLLRSGPTVRTAASARPGPGAQAARSRSDSPPQTPYRSPYWIAWVAHWRITGHPPQIAFARVSRASRWGGRSPSGGKNTALSTWRQAARNRHDHNADVPVSSKGSCQACIYFPAMTTMPVQQRLEVRRQPGSG